MRDEDRGRVAADRHQGAVAEGDLPGVAGQQVQADDRDEVDADQGKVEGVEVADEPRDDGHEGHRSHGDQGSGADSGRPPHQTFLTLGRPKMPSGRTSRTPRITASATGSFNTFPTQPT